jgi:hypothetical protein
MTAFVVNRDEKDLRVFALAINELTQGRSNATGSVTLTANAASTAVSNDNFAAASTVYFTATTANAAAEVGAGTMYISARAKGSFTITHANNAQTDRTYLYAIVG